MKRMITFVALYAALAHSGLQAQDHAQDDARQRWKTCGLTNGRFWNEVGSVETPASSFVQTAYLMGLMDMKNVFTSGAEGPGIWSWPKGATVGEVRQSLNQFYQDPANLQIPIASAVQVIKSRFEGKDPKTIEESIAFDRQVATRCQQQK
jgi:hypothetical protein